MNPELQEINEKAHLFSSPCQRPREKGRKEGRKEEHETIQNKVEECRMKTSWRIGGRCENQREPRNGENAKRTRQHNSKDITIHSSKSPTQTTTQSINRTKREKKTHIFLIRNLRLQLREPKHQHHLKRQHKIHLPRRIPPLPHRHLGRIRFHRAHRRELGCSDARGNKKEVNL